MDLQIENIKQIMDDLDLGALLPEIDSVLDFATAMARFSIFLGPVIMLAFGLVYWFLAPKEANYQAGYRFRWGMGSVEAWQFMQRLAGIVWTSLGGVLTLVMLVLWILYAKLSLDELLMKAIVCLLWQGGLMLLSILAIDITVFLRYDFHGKRRSSVKEIIGL